MKAKKYINDFLITWIMAILITFVWKGFEIIILGRVYPNGVDFIIVAILTCLWYIWNNSRKGDE